MVYCFINCACDEKATELFVIRRQIRPAAKADPITLSIRRQGQFAKPQPGGRHFQRHALKPLQPRRTGRSKSSTSAKLVGDPIPQHRSSTPWPASCFSAANRDMTSPKSNFCATGYSANISVRNKLSPQALSLPHWMGQAGRERTACLLYTSPSPRD